MLNFHEETFYMVMKMLLVKRSRDPDNTPGDTSVRKRDRKEGRQQPAPDKPESILFVPPHPRK